MSRLPRGIDPELLISQVKNTMPYLFDESEGSAIAKAFKPGRFFRELALSEKHLHEEPELTHFEYFRLCLYAHYLTVGTPVPTDVDNQIRFRLWPKQVPVETAVEMAELVLESHSFDFTVVSARHTSGAETTEWEAETVSGHLGEWFTVAAAAYSALGQYGEPEAKQRREKILGEIAREVDRHSEIFGSLWRAGDGVGALTASASLAHNFGDLDRVVDMWKLPVHDPLRLHFYQLAVRPFDPNGKLRYKGRLWVAGELYKASISESAMALENHRHFALRKPRVLRQSRDFLIPIGPFFDDWGSEVGRKSSGNHEVVSEVVDALLHGWERLPKTVGYGRALFAIKEAIPAVFTHQQEEKWNALTSARPGAQLPKAEFVKAWNDKALTLMDEIPSRA